MTQTHKKTLVTVTLIIAIAALITSLNISNPDQPNAPLFNTASTNPIPTPSQSTPSTPNTSQSTPNPFNPNQAKANTANTPNPHFPPGFPEPLPPLDPAKLKQTDDLIAQGDAIVAKMNTLIAGMNLPKIEPNPAEQAKLEAQRKIQQTRLDDIKAQLDTLQGDSQ